MIRHTIILTLFFLLSIKTTIVAQIDVNHKSESDKPKLNIGITLLGGTCVTSVKTNDYYFNTTDKNRQLYKNGGLGFILDLPLTKKNRLWMNPELMLIELRNPFLSMNFTIQHFFTKTFFVLAGASVASDNFQNTGLGASLGLGIKPLKRFSFILQNRMSYYKLQESTPYVKYTTLQLPISLVIKFDISSSEKKNRTIKAKNAATIYDKLIEEHKPDSTALKGLTYEDLTYLLEMAAKDKDYVKAQKIQIEMNVRESSGNLNDISVERLRKMLKKAVKMKDYEKAAKIQTEIDKRGK